jgi:hypothetical protein
MHPVLGGALKGAAGGLAGAAVMTLGEKAEQAFTGRPDSYVPGRTLAHLLGLGKPDEDRRGRNWAMHYGTGAAAGMLRAGLAAANLRGPGGSLMFTWLRLSIDQTLENATGVGAPPWTWPREELVTDVAETAVYAFATGAIVDALVPPGRGSSARRRMTRLRLPGFS